MLGNHAGSVLKLWWVELLCLVVLGFMHGLLCVASQTTVFAAVPFKETSAHPISLACRCGLFFPDGQHTKVLCLLRIHLQSLNLFSPTSQLSSSSPQIAFLILSTAVRVKRFRQSELTSGPDTRFVCTSLCAGSTCQFRSWHCRFLVHATRGEKCHGRIPRSGQHTGR